MSHIRLCPYNKGISQNQFLLKWVSWQAGGILAFFAAGLKFVSVRMMTWAVGMMFAGLAALLCLFVWWTQFVKVVPEVAFSVVARADEILDDVRGPGIHFAFLGDEYHEIGRNPIPVEVTTRRTLKDSATVTVTVKFTVRPNPRIANAKGKNAYAYWVIEGRRHGQSEVAEHNVQEALKRPVEGVLNTILGVIDSETLDQNQLGLALLIESEVALQTPLHKIKMTDGSFLWEKLFDEQAPVGIVETLEAYNKHHGEIRAKIDEIGDLWDYYEEMEGDASVAFEVEHDPLTGAKTTMTLQKLADITLSHHEAYVGCTFNHLELVRCTYDKPTLKARQKQYDATQVKAAAETLMEVIKKHVGGTEGLEKVSPDTRYSGALAIVDKGTHKGITLSGADEEMRKRFLEGLAMGEGMSEGGGKHS